jgi:hypothetical protein
MKTERLKITAEAAEIVRDRITTQIICEGLDFLRSPKAEIEHVIKRAMEYAAMKQEKQAADLRWAKFTAYKTLVDAGHVIPGGKR